MTELERYQHFAEQLRYDPETGLFWWREAGRKRVLNKPAGSKNNHGYWTLGACVEGKFLRVSGHRLAYFITVGSLPEEVDHINNDRLDNRWVNLRECTVIENRRNRTSRKGSSSQFLGVHWCNTYKKWRASINSEGKYSTLGRFDCEKEAASHYNLAAMELYGEFANLNDVR